MGFGSGGTVVPSVCSVASVGASVVSATVVIAEEEGSAGTCSDG